MQFNQILEAMQRVAEVPSVVATQRLTPQSCFAALAQRAVQEAIELLPLDEQEDLINIIKYRQIERRREEIAANIAKAHQEYDQNEVFRGTVDDVIAELNE